MEVQWGGTKYAKRGYKDVGEEVVGCV